jgi:hypothetical protein
MLTSTTSHSGFPAWARRAACITEGDKSKGESGTTLVLALIFMSVVSLIVFALVSWSGNNINTVAAFQSGRTVNYAVNSAMETAIQDVRYSPMACPSTGLTVPSNNINVTIYCTPNSQTPVTEGATAASRVITFKAFTCDVSASGCANNPYLQVVATFDDYSSSSVMALGPSVMCSATCGTTMRINSWTFAQSP